MERRTGESAQQVLQHESDGIEQEGDDEENGAKQRQGLLQTPERAHGPPNGAVVRGGRGSVYLEARKAGQAQWIAEHGGNV